MSILKDFLSLWGGRFPKIRKFIGGLWIYCEVPEISFREWVKLDGKLASAFDRFECGKSLKHEDYRK